MNKVVDINKYKNKQQRSWLRVHETRLNRIISHHISNNLGIALDDVAHAYRTQQVANLEESWDQWDLRDLISEVLSKTGIVQKIYVDLSKEVWFKQKMISEEKLLDLCVSRYILDKT
jgi:hypothetical protein